MSKALLLRLNLGRWRWVNDIINLLEGVAIEDYDEKALNTKSVMFK